MKNAFLLSLAGLLVVLFTGCDFTQKYCERAVDCMGEEVFTVDECVSASDQAAADAETAGCDAEYDDYSTCSYKKSECTDSVYSAGTDCDAEYTALVDCLTAAASGE